MEHAKRDRAANVTAVALWALAIGGLALTIAFEAKVRSAGRWALVTDPSQVFVYGSATVSAATVGVIIAIRRPRNPIGWLFLAFGIALAVGGTGDAYALDRAVVEGQRGAGPALALVASQASFIAWFGLLAAILHLTPTGRPIGSRWRRAMTVTAAATVVGLAAKAIQDPHFEPPYAAVRNPWAIRSLSSGVNAVAAVAITAAAFGLIVAAASLVVRFRRARGDDRRQLRWMVAIVIPLPLLVVISAVASIIDASFVRTLATGGYVALIPVAAGLSVQRYRLYEVDRIVSRAAAYMLWSAAVVTMFIAVTAVVGRAVAGFADGSTVPAVLATAVTVSAALPVLRSLQDLVDRRFDRRRYQARRLVAEHLSEAGPTRSLEATLAAALHAPTLSVAYWLPEQLRWATSEGHDADIEPGDIEVSRGDAPVARLRLRLEHPDTRLARELASQAVAELDNIRLRAELVAQLGEVRESRARIVTAQASERHRIERNLHDGAQQRLLALAMHLRARQLRGGDGSDHDLLDQAVDELGCAIQELRDLANGLHPTVLADGGLAAALDDLAGRAALPVRIDVQANRLPLPIEEALWFVACEAVANAVKHSEADSIEIQLRIDQDVATLICRDDGVGGADPTGSGLRGITDRTDAAGGHLHIESAPGRGTVIEAVVPCAS